MRKLSLALVSAILVLSLSACTCSAEKQVVAEFKNSHVLLTTKLMKYVNADPNITGNPADSEDKKKKAREDWQFQVNKDLENIEKLQKALEK